MLITDLFYNYVSILLVYVLINLNVIKLENVISSFQLVYLTVASRQWFPPAPVLLQPSLT
jgi:hypothetical protein